VRAAVATWISSRSPPWKARPTLVRSTNRIPQTGSESYPAAERARPSETPRADLRPHSSGRVSLPQKPRLRPRVAAAELQQHVGDLLPALLRGVDAILTEVLALPDQSVAFSRRDSVGPQVRSPEEHGSGDLAFLRVVVQLRIALDLVLNQPAHR